LQSAGENRLLLVKTMPLILQVASHISEHVRTLALHHLANALLEILALLVHVDLRNLVLATCLVACLIWLHLILHLLRCLLLLWVEQLALLCADELTFCTKTAVVFAVAFALLKTIAILPILAPLLLLLASIIWLPLSHLVATKVLLLWLLRSLPLLRLLEAVWLLLLRLPLILLILEADPIRAWRVHKVAVTSVASASIFNVSAGSLSALVATGTAATASLAKIASHVLILHVLWLGHSKLLVGSLGIGTLHF
jgi:hypothetical protein